MTKTGPRAKQAGRDPWRIGVLFSRSGLMAITESEHFFGTALAIEEINKAGGILGREIEVTAYDPGSLPETYRKMETVDALGASLAASGLADIASYEGHYADAVRILEGGVAADSTAKNADNAAEKLAGIAQLQLLRGQKGAAVAAATKALSMSRAVPVRVLAARALLEAGEIAKAQKLADGLASDVQPETQAYAKMIDGNLALRRGDKNAATRMFSEANQLLDTWIGRFELGRAYLEAGQFVEADSEFDKCIKRRGEVLEIFLDSVPTIAYFPPTYYYQGRVREGLKSPGFAEPYRTYLDIRGKAGEDPLLADIRRRLGR